MVNYIFLIQALETPDHLKLYVQIGAIVAAAVGLLTFFLTRTLPWLKAKLESRSVEKRVGAELYTAANIERSIRYYIPPFCQDIDPAGAEEPRLVYGVKQKLFDALDDALSHPTEYRYLILLADSGMGKTSALINYYVRHIRRWRKRYKLALIPLGIPDADERIAAVEDKRNTIIFLDALDEDTLAIVDHVERLRILLNSTRDFHRVLISCRTQFFSKDEEIPKATGTLKVGSRAAGEPAEYVFHKIYLSPFSDEQVNKYIRRRYPIWKPSRRKQARLMVKKIPHLTARPMLLAHIDDLVQAKRHISKSYELYEEMVEAWLKREEGFIREKDDLRQFSERLAVDLYVNRAKRGAERIPKPELTALAKEWNIELDEWKLSGRSLLNRDADGNFKFAHRSIMEYLFVRRLFRGDSQCLEVDWTDQIYTFFEEILLSKEDSLADVKLMREQFWARIYAHSPMTLINLAAEFLVRTLHEPATASRDYLNHCRTTLVLCRFIMNPYQYGTNAAALYKPTHPGKSFRFIRIIAESAFHPKNFSAKETEDNSSEVFPDMIEFTEIPIPVIANTTDVRIPVFAGSRLIGLLWLFDSYKRFDLHSIEAFNSALENKSRVYWPRIASPYIAH